MIPVEHLFSPVDALSHPVPIWVGILGMLASLLGLGIAFMLFRSGKIGQPHYIELKKRCLTWAGLIPILFVPIVLGAVPTMLGVGLLSLLCYREYARATGLFRHRLVSAVVVVGILLTTFASIDNYYRLFVAVWPITVSLLAAAAVLKDQPSGYIQRVALAIFAFMLFGAGLGHLGFIANDTNYRAILVWILLCTELNDVFAYCSGKFFGRKKLCPNTSPNKTVAGALGALLLTTLLTVWVGRYVFAGQPMARPVCLIVVGMLISIAAQFGDLMLSSIKRDLGIKDMATVLPGHGGLLDRFDSLLFVAPVVFHIVNYVQGIGVGQAANLITGALGNP